MKIYFSRNGTKTEPIDNLVSTRIDDAVRRVDELGNALRCELLSMNEAATAFSKLSYDLNYMNSMYIRKEDLNK